MAYKDPLTEGEVQSINLKSVRSWLKANASKVKAKHNKAMLYSGRDDVLEELKGLDGKITDAKDRKTFMGTPMYKKIEKIRKNPTKHNVPINFETINDVLKRLKSPEIIDRDRIKINYAHANECFSDLENKPKLFPKPVADKVWGVLSGFFAKNATGDVAIMDGAADDYGRLQADKDYISKEMPKLLKNKNLSPKTIKELKKQFGKHGAHFDRRYTKLIKEIGIEKKVLKGKPK